MLATSDHISTVNFSNYVNNGFPVDSSNEEGYEYLEMTDIDADGYPSDSTYLDTIGDTDAWQVWNAGKWRWNRIRRYKLEGVLRRDMGIDTPISGGYREDKHTLVAEFPDHLLKAASKARASNLEAKRMLGGGKK